MIYTNTLARLPKGIDVLHGGIQLNNEQPKFGHKQNLNWEKMGPAGELKHMKVCSMKLQVVNPN